MVSEILESKHSFDILNKDEGVPWQSSYGCFQTEFMSKPEVN